LAVPQPCLEQVLFHGSVRNGLPQVLNAVDRPDHHRGVVTSSRRDDSDDIVQLLASVDGRWPGDCPEEAVHNDVDIGPQLTSGEENLVEADAGGKPEHQPTNVVTGVHLGLSRRYSHLRHTVISGGADPARPVASGSRLGPRAGSVRHGSRKGPASQDQVGHFGR